MYDNQDKYLRKLGVFDCTITKVGTKPAKGQHEEKMFITFESMGKLIDQEFKMSSLKAADDSKAGMWAKKQLKELMELCGVKKASELVGRRVAVFVAPSFWQGKGPYWNPKGFFDPKYLLDESAGLDAALGGMDDLMGKKDAVDEIQF